MADRFVSDDEPVNVLWLIKGLGHGGAETLLVSAAQVANRSRYAFEVASVSAEQVQLVGQLDEAGVQAHLLGAPPQAHWSWPRRLRALMSSGRFDVVHAHSPLVAGVARIVLQTIPRKRRPAFVYSEHSEWGGYRVPTRLLNALTAPVDGHRWAVSERVRSSMWPWIARSSEVLNQGIDLASFDVAPEARGRIREELGIPEGAVVACTVANLRWEKDYPNLFAASRIALRAVPELVVVAVGQGPLQSEVEQMRQALGVGDRVKLLGFRSDIAEVLAASDLFIVASAYEGGPLSLIEALASGLPIASTEVGFVPDVIHPGVEGYVVPPRDPEALAAAVIALASDKELRKRMGSAARQASYRFDIRRAVARQCEVYEELAMEQRARVHMGTPLRSQKKGSSR